MTAPTGITLLTMQKISTLSGDVNCFFDDGSTCCLILHSTAKRLGLKGERIQMRLSTVNGIVESESFVYHISLVDRDNASLTIKVFAVNWIAAAIQKVDLGGVKDLFSSKIQNDWDKVKSRPSGNVEVLIGSNFLGLHPTDLEIQYNLKLKESKFSSGLVLAGSHKSLQLQEPQKFPPNPVNASVCATNLQYRSIRDYFDSNELQVEAPRRCNNCLNCKECTYQGHQMSLRKQFENKVMENNA